MEYLLTVKYKEKGLFGRQMIGNVEFSASDRVTSIGLGTALKEVTKQLGAKKGSVVVVSSMELAS